MGDAILNLDHLSKRLATIAHYVPKGSRLLDVGSDHAYLPAYLAQHGRISYGIASEVAKGPFRNTVREIQSHRLESVLHPRLANGLRAITFHDRINVITISGMGGPLIKNILDQGQAKLVNHPLLILQPNVDAYVVRKWLMSHHYRISHERIIDDHHEIYEILVGQWTTRPVRYTHDQLLFGPKLIERQGSVFVRKWSEEVRHLAFIVKQMNRSTRKPVRRIQQVKKRIQLIRKVINREG